MSKIFNKYSFVLLLIFVFSCKATKNKIPEIINNDSIFLLYENNKSIKKSVDRNSLFTKESYLYMLLDVEKFHQSTDNLRFYYGKYKDFDQMEYGNTVPVFNVNKEIVKNNKDNIITLDYMKQLGYEKSLRLFKNAKHIFLIDQTEIVDNKLTIKEVFFLYTGVE